MHLICITALLMLTAGEVCAEASAGRSGPCDTALAQGTICEPANQRALETMRARKLEAIIVMQDVRTGNVVVSAASEPGKLDVTTPLLPLSTVKLMVAASWLDHESTDHLTLANSEELLRDSIVSGNDNAGRQLASALRMTLGTEGLLKDLERYGFGSAHSLGKDTSEKDWGDTLSIGEERFTVTASLLCRFLEAVGNGGVMHETATLKLQAAMRAVVERGTAKSAAPILADTGWQIGGKTGTGPDIDGKAGPGSDGWFAGLVFDPQGKARFAFATFVRHGGLGGGNAARISAEVARFIIGADSRQ